MKTRSTRYLLCIGLFALSLLFFTKLNAQALNHVPGQLIVHLPKGHPPQHLIQEYATFQGKNTQLQLTKTLSNELNIQLYSFDYQEINEYQFIKKIKRAPFVIQAQFNHWLSPRNTWPNDPLMDFQWHWFNSGGNMGLMDADIDAELAWDITTGGTTPNGTEIVIALLDDGLDLQHEDFQGNFWVNEQEVYNGIDDDGNGYVDDHYGWNVINQNDYIGYGTHGTQVAGLMGAIGNNGLGVTGLNWNVKIMPVYSDWMVESEVIEGYSYVLANRRLYNQTGGEKGAFVVATNLSWGVDGVPASEAPIWCAIYDSLGTAGILNIGATSNTIWDVDEMGDLPTNCTSEYFLGVTASTEYDELSNAAYGPLSIDLAAPGRNIYTTECCNNYAFKSGTSFAAPQVTALAALLYSAPCPYLEELSWENPAAAVQLVKESILQGVDSIAALDGLVGSGGRLNAYKSLQWLLSVCNTCAPPPAPIAQAGDEDGTLLVSWDSSYNLNLHFRKAGSPYWNVLPNQSPPVLIDQLEFCSQYELKTSYTCGSGELLFSPTAGNSTTGCCRAPTETSAEIQPDGKSVLLKWNTTAEAFEYLLQYRPEQSNEWTEITTTDTSVLLLNLNPCTPYTWRVVTHCDFLPPQQNTPTYSFSLSGCEDCTQIDYCIPELIYNDYEWIETLQIDQWQWESGQDEGGYALHNQASPLRLTPGESSSVAVLSGGQGSFWQELFSLWIDFNRDGQFTPPDELLWLSPQAVDVGKWATGQFDIPADLPEGYYRMRLNMWWSELSNDPESNACLEYGTFGESEDYCVFIGDDNCPVPENISIIQQNEQSILIQWDINTPPPGGYLLRLSKEDQRLQDIAIPPSPPNGTQFLLQELAPCQTYTLYIESICNGETIQSLPIQFYTEAEGCLTDLPLQILPSPNPFVEQLSLELLHPTSYTGPVQLSWYDSSGKLLFEQLLHTSEHNSRLSPNVAQLPRGLLLLKIQLDTGEKRVLKMLKL